MAANTPPLPAGSAVNSPNAQSAPTLTRANINPNSEIKITLVVGASPNNSGNNILILKTLVPTYLNSQLSTAVPDQTNVTLTSSVSASGALSEYFTYMSLAGLRIGYIRINAGNTALYNGNLNFGVMPFTGKTNPAFWPLGQYAIPNGSGGYLAICTINTDPQGNAMNMPLTPDTYMYFDNLPASATYTISFGVVGSGELVIN